MASDFLPVPGVTVEELADAALLASLADETPEGRSIVALATGEFGRRASEAGIDAIVPFAAETRLSGVDHGGRRLRKGAVDSVLRFAGLSDSNTPRNSGRRSTGSPEPAARRSPSPTATGCSA